MMPRGQTLIIISVLTSTLLLYSLALINISITARQTEKKEDLKLASLDIAEAGLAKAIWCFNQTGGANCGGSYGGNFSGETNVSFAGGVFDVAVTTINVTTKQIEATGFYPNKINPKSKSRVVSRVSTQTDQASFTYGAQVGRGGLQMGSNARVIGSVYSHGDIEGESGARITGDVYVAGGTALNTDQEQTTYNSDFIFGRETPAVDIAQSFTPASSEVLNKASFYLKKIGNPSNLSVKIVNDIDGAPAGMVLANSTLNSGLVGTNYDWIDVAFGAPPYLQSGARYWIVLDAAQNNSRYWSIGADAFDNYAGGTMVYSPNWSDGNFTASGRDINFKTWMGGIDTGIDDLTVDGNAYAHYFTDGTVGGDASVYTITNATVGRNALANSISNATIGWNATTTNISNATVGYNLWCQTYNNVTVGRARYCPTTVAPPSDPGPANWPVSPAMIADWKTDAEAGGIIEGNYRISNNISLGPKKINGNLTIDNNQILTLTGALYITGSVTVGNGASIILDNSYGGASGILISDGPVMINNNAVLSGAENGSYLLILSTNNHPTEAAIEINNNANSAIFYAPSGVIKLDNNAALKEAAAYKLILGSNVNLTYESGLADIAFSTGPTGGWGLIKGSWRIAE